MKRSLLIAALCCGWAASGLANEATLVNTSTEQHPLRIVYRMAFKNPQSQIVFGPPQTIQLDPQQKNTIHFEMNGYHLAGLVPISINGHPLPENVNAFNQPQQCSLTTDRKHNTGILTIHFHESEGHGQLTCGVHGGIFN